MHERNMRETDQTERRYWLKICYEKSKTPQINESILCNLRQRNKVQNVIAPIFDLK